MKKTNNTNKEKFHLNQLKFSNIFRLRDYNFGNLKISLVFYCLISTILGIVVIGSAEKTVQGTQIKGLIIGLIVMIVFSLLDYKFLVRFYWILYLLSILLLLGVVVSGSTSGGAERWLILGPIRFQPSEIVKIFLIIFFAEFFKENKARLNSWRFLVLTIALIGFPLLLIAAQPDLSTTVVIGIMWVSIIFVAGLDKKIIARVLSVVIPLFLIGFFLITRPNMHILQGYQQKRILAWLHPEEYADSEAMQQQNSMMAIGSGKISGKGLNNNKVASMKNGNFVPEPQTDFIFAVIGEELGFIGTMSVIILIMMIVFSCLNIAKLCFDPAGRLICVGLACLIGFQAIVNIAVTTGLLPNTGVTLPFISYGLTSLVSFYVGIGIVINISLQPGGYKY